jgi:hypothetical protein
MNLPDAPIAHEGFFATYFVTMSDQDKSKDFYVRRSALFYRAIRTITAGNGAATGLSPEGRPIGTFLFLGPTGTAKTRAAEATAGHAVR